MESTKNLLARFWPTGGIIIIGFIFIIYIALGLVYLQQNSKQKGLTQQITQLSAVLGRPLASSEELQQKYDDITINLTSMTDSEAIAMLVSIAEQSGIDISNESGKLRIPSATFRQETIGGNTYRLMCFRNVTVQGSYDNIMAFISDLDSGATKETMVLKKIAVNKVEFTFTGVEGDRRAEFRSVASAVLYMMMDNGLFENIPHPMSSADGVATNFMGDNPDTPGIVEGFPDITTTAAEKFYSGNATPRGGYVLYNHDKISMADTTQYQTVNYFSTLTTQYYYTCEADGTIRQWDGPNVSRAMEYVSSEKTTVETKIIVDIDIYTKPQ